MSVGAAEAASFSIPFTIVQALDSLSLMLGNSITAEVSRAGGVLTSAARAYMRRIWIIVAILSVLICALASPALQVFGDKYRAGGTLILQIFMIANLPRSILFLGIAVQRARGRGRPILILQAIAALGTLALGFALMRPLGAAGMALGWLIASCAAALVAFIFLPHGANPGRHRRGRPVRQARNLKLDEFRGVQRVTID
jgi:O-antigen/teichoic acid export membrane protein